ncbi:MAG: MltA domain-containing protein [Phycisphaerae bacterium]
MLRIPVTLVALIGIITVLTAGCAAPEPVAIEPPTKDYDRPLGPGELALRKITDPAMLPAFDRAFYSVKDGTLERAIRNSLNYLAKPSSQSFFPYGDITHELATATLDDFLTIVHGARTSEEFDRIIRERYDTYMSVGCVNDGTVLFTGYYCPIFDGSLTQTERFRHPLFKKPPDLTMDPNDPDGRPIGGPWHKRREIESSQMLRGQELVWLGDPFEAYVISVQGSGKIRLSDGSLFEIGYAGNNGHDYTSVGRELIADGRLAKEGLSLDALIQYFREHPEDVDEYLFRNDRYIFFQPAQGGPYGCLNEPVLPLASIATDKEVFPRACLALLSTRLAMRPGEAARPYMGFTCDQDRGAAIRAAGRCDIFRGTGDDAGKLAGHTYSEGRLYYIFLKPEYAGASDDDVDPASS